MATLPELAPTNPQPATMDGVIIIKGHSSGPDGKWDEVQAIQHQPFIYISYCGHQDDNGIQELLDMMAKHRLEIDWEVAVINPCHAADNPAWHHGCDPSIERWIDGERMYAADGVVRFHGNFEKYAFAFGIDTNHKPTIDTLMAAIENNRLVTE